MAIELEVLEGTGGWEGSKGNITSYSYKESSTPLQPDDSSGATASFTVGVSEDETLDGTFALLDARVKLQDDDIGSSVGIVRTVESTDGNAGLEIESIMSYFNAEAFVPPVNGTLEQAIDLYMDIAGVPDADYTVYATIATRAVQLQGWSGPMWDGIKKLCAAQSIEVSLVSGVVFFRPIRLRLGNHDQDMSATLNINATTVAKTIEIYYYNNTYNANGMIYPVPGDEDASIIQVGSGEVIQTAATVNASIMQVFQPIVVDYIPRELNQTLSSYTVMDKNNVLVPSEAWEAAGGSVVVTIGADPTQITITTTGAILDSLGPFRIAMPEGDNDTYSSLRIIAEGIFFDKQLLTLPTGADPSKAIDEVGVTVDNPFVNTLNDACKLGTRTAKRYTGRDKSINVQATSIADLSLTGQIVAYSYQEFEDDNHITYAEFETAWADKTYADFSAFARNKNADTRLIQAFGNVVGTRVPYRDSMYRIRDASYSEESLQYTGESDTMWNDFEDTYEGVTYNEFQTVNAGRTYNDFSLRPLHLDEVLSETIYNLAPMPYPTPAIPNLTVSNTSNYWFTSSTSVAATAAVTAPDGTPGYQMTRLTTAALALYSRRAVAGDRMIQAQLGDTFTFMGNVWADRSQNIQFGIGYANGSNTLNGVGGSFALIAGQTYPYRVTFTVTQAIMDVTGGQMYPKWTSPSGTVGDRLIFSKMGLFKGEYDGPFVTGDTPNWFWTGTPNLSTSYGFPYTLESVAGVPDGVLTGNASLASTPITPSSPFQGRTLYSVFDVIDTTFGSPEFGRMGAAAQANGAMRLIGSAANLQGSWYTVNSSGATTSPTVPRRTVGRHVMAMTYPTGGGGNGSVTIDGTTDVVRMVNAHDGMPDASLRNTTSNSSSANVVQYGYLAEHTRTTRLAILKWLANFYNLPLVP